MKRRRDASRRYPRLSSPTEIPKIESLTAPRRSSFRRALIRAGGRGSARVDSLACWRERGSSARLGAIGPRRRQARRGAARRDPRRSSGMMSDPAGGGRSEGTAQRHFAATVSDGQEVRRDARVVYLSLLSPRGKKPDVLARRAGRSLVRAYGLLTFIF